jgi:cystathionine beta-lyase
MTQQAATSPDFDRVIDRRGTHSSKWDNMEARTRARGDDAIAMWTADMDFMAAEPIRARLRDLAEFGVFGYYARDESWREAICGWAKSRHGWEVDPDWIRRAPGVCAGLSFAIQAFSEPGEGVVVFAPVYHAFASVIRANGRRLVEAPLAVAQGRYRMDLEDAGRMLPADARVVVLCNPHNPGGGSGRRRSCARLGISAWSAG